MLNITDETKFFIACPASFQTGGTEALHVLAFELRNLGFNAIMYYFNVKESEDVVGERFKCFNLPYVFEIVDSEQNILVVPELGAKFFKGVEKIQKVFWWLSVDNYFRALPKRTIKNWFKKHILKEDIDINKVDLNDSKILHLAQSQYAWDFLEKKNIKRKAFLADYLRDDFFKNEADLTSKNRKDVILYNPAKGYKFTKKLIEYANDLKFVPLVNLTPEQVCELCKSSKIYIDFGNHPGKDRFPREAAIQGTIVITGKQGSAAFMEDLPIPDGYKFDQNNVKLSEIVQLLKDCLKNYDKHIWGFEEYRTFIKQDKEKFISDLKKIVNL